MARADTSPRPMRPSPQASLRWASSAANALDLGAARCDLVGLRPCLVATVTTDATSSHRSNKGTTTFAPVGALRPRNAQTLAPAALPRQRQRDHRGRGLLGRLRG